MFCAISGQAAEKPVFCVKTGLVYEERLLRNALDANGKCPVTGVAVEAEKDVHEVKASAVTAPRPPGGSSFPSLLGALQEEWDSVLLEQVALRKELLETRKDLSTALYEREAATAVIARLLEENDELKAALEAGGGAESAKAAAKSKAGGEPAFAKVVARTEEGYRAARAKVKAKAGEGGVPVLGTQGGGPPAALKEANALDLSETHQGDGTVLTCIAAEAYNIANQEWKAPWVATGGSDGRVSVVDVGANEVVGSLTQRKLPIRDLSLLSGLLAAAGDDKVVEVWGGDWPAAGSGAKVSLSRRLSLAVHEAPVRACPLHPSGALLASASSDGRWVLSDLASGDALSSGALEWAGATDSVLECARMHPDGKLLACGDSAGALHVFDLSRTAGAGPAIDPLSHGAGVRALAFSENGYHMASAGEDGRVLVWDLRKLMPCATLESVAEGVAATAVHFDVSGVYLAAAYANGAVRVAQRPERKKAPWPLVLEHACAAQGPAALSWAPGASGLWTAGTDRSLRTWTS